MGFDSNKSRKKTNLMILKSPNCNDQKMTVNSKYNKTRLLCRYTSSSSKFFPACSLVANELLIACGVWMRFWMWFSARMDTSLKTRILKSSYFWSWICKKVRRAFLIVNHEYMPITKNWGMMVRRGHFKKLFRKKYTWC